MTDYNREDQFLRQRLQKEIPILRAMIQNLYRELDRKLHLNGANVPVTFGYDTDTLGSYTRRSAHEKEYFHFSLSRSIRIPDHPYTSADSIHSPSSYVLRSVLRS